MTLGAHWDEARRMSIALQKRIDMQILGIIRGKRMTPKQAARKWRKSAETVRRWCREGRIPHERIGRTIEIPPDTKPPRFGNLRSADNPTSIP